MLTFVIAVGAVMLPVILGGILAFGVSRLDSVVTETKEEVENRDKGYNQTLTLGHKIKVGLEPDDQLHEARLLAAKKAASLPRGANMRIGRLGQPTLKPASKGLKDDPWTSVKIARFHGWDGAKLGTAAAAAATAGAVAGATAVAAPGGKIQLVPGKDYEHVEVTAAMSGAEKRQARIANAKAKARAYKAAKAVREAGGAPVAAAVAAAPTAAGQPAAVAAPVATGIAEPNYIEITDDMSPDDVRKARIQNSKEKSKYNKALKAAGFDPQAVEAGEVVVPTAAPQQAVAAPAVAPAAVATPAAASGPDAAALAAIPKPDYIEITDSMSPDEIRQARIQNSKARSAYNKALKAAGIDPNSVE